MSDASERLLDAAIQHLEELKARGVRFVSVAPDTLAGLNRIQASPAGKKSVGFSGPVPGQPEKEKPSPGLSDLVKSTQSVAAELPLAAPRQTPQAPIARPKLSPEAKVAAFADLRQRALACTKCQHLAASRKNVV